jgi:hypothetical protein
MKGRWRSEWRYETLFFLKRKPAHALRIHAHMTEYTENLCWFIRVHSGMLMKCHGQLLPHPPNHLGNWLSQLITINYIYLLLGCVCVCVCVCVCMRARLYIAKYLPHARTVESQKQPLRTRINNRKTGLWNPFLGNDSVDTFLQAQWRHTPTLPSYQVTYFLCCLRYATVELCFLCCPCSGYISRVRFPCGGGVEYLHRDPASRRRRRKGKSQIGDSKIRSQVPRD